MLSLRPVQGGIQNINVLTYIPWSAYSDIHINTCTSAVLLSLTGSSSWYHVSGSWKGKVYEYLEVNSFNGSKKWYGLGFVLLQQWHWPDWAQRNACLSWHFSLLKNGLTQFWQNGGCHNLVPIFKWYIGASLVCTGLIQRWLFHCVQTAWILSSAWSHVRWHMIKFQYQCIPQQLQTMNEMAGNYPRCSPTMTPTTLVLPPYWHCTNSQHNIHLWWVQGWNVGPQRLSVQCLRLVKSTMCVFGK